MEQTITIAIFNHGIRATAKSRRTLCRSKQAKKMKNQQKVVSLRVNFEDTQNTTYVIVGTDDVEIANQIAREWAENKIGRTAAEVVINKGIMDIPGYGV